MTRDSQSIVLSLQRATHRLLQVLDTAAKEVGISQVEMNTLANLQGSELWTVSQLGRATGLRPSTATGVLDRLEERALLERRPNPTDRRSATVVLTPEGEQLARSVLAAIRSVDERIRRSTPDASLVGYHEVIGAIGALPPALQSGGGPDAR